MPTSEVGTLLPFERHWFGSLEVMRSEVSASRLAVCGRGSRRGGQGLAALTALRCSGRGRAAHLSPCSLRSHCERRQRVRWGSSRLQREPTPALRSSPPQRSPLPHTASREVHRGLFAGALRSSARARALR